ncbi:hypothetical protein PC129_g13010 [Phytophthora cactorum]|uniref:Helitron helicase-like domain-containing protein n=1 Tax=Phytophthora cactorum TaxID=29920 RepID=A0A329RX67_9STRA|nr:hypothetical protein Pcac1_g25659 [Phytophthora cactorum]KAG2836565.1 hypothetical protein PC111_g4964 [Phytophthora cactorum]KAG2862466.1 hypothetical protein PC113_g6280 [Phytophthora cactorum]KAG2898388.1 hypothetical protein PC114_g14303 [Phytophthora cactorum]KAG2911263.1 hypothetical protein PC115_g12602 [Phytophthora cactorum]
MSLREYESYLLHGRTDSDSLILKGSRLTQQYCVDQWAKCEQERMRFIKKTQLQYRLESIQRLADALRNESVEVHHMAADGIGENASRPTSRRNNTVDGDSGEPEAGEIWRKVIRPPKFTGGPRYMY